MTLFAHSSLNKSGPSPMPLYVSCNINMNLGLFSFQTAVARGDLSQKISGVVVSGEMLALVVTINNMIEGLNEFATQVKMVAQQVGTHGKLGVQAAVGSVEGIWREITYVELYSDGLNRH
jgi:hypothetical protein